MKKIAFVIYTLSGGGAERVVSLLSSEFSKLGHEVDIITFSDEVFYEFQGNHINLDCPSVKNYIGKIFNIGKRVYKLKKVFKQKKYDKIIAFMEGAYLPAILTGENIIASVRNNPNKYSKFITKNILSKAKKIVVPSKDMVLILEQDFGINNVITINNPIDFELIDRLKQEKIEEKFPFIIATGRLHYQKGFDILIEAYSKSKVKDYAKLLIFGEGSLKKDLQNLINKKGLKDKVILKGKTHNLYKYLSKAEIFVLSSRYEGYPNVLIEALACEIPCVSTNCPTGPNEIIQNGINGLLVENKNIEELIKTMDRLFFDEKLKKRFKENARKSVQHLSIEKIAQKWLNI